jgi:hypothetical protein
MCLGRHLTVSIMRTIGKMALLLLWLGQSSAGNAAGLIRLKQTGPAPTRSAAYDSITFHRSRTLRGLVDWPSKLRGMIPFWFRYRDCASRTGRPFSVTIFVARAKLVAPGGSVPGPNPQRYSYTWASHAASAGGTFTFPVQGQKFYLFQFSVGRALHCAWQMGGGPSN